MQREGDPSKNPNTQGGDVGHIKTKSTQPRSLSPLRSITVITEAGPVEIPAKGISADLVGLKAYGLSSLPQEWVPPFFLITASCFEQSLPDETINAWAIECLANVGIDAGIQVMVRSSGTSETMQNRGQLISKSCVPSQVASTIRELVLQLPQMPSSKVHWIIQEHVNPKEKGHLSNERRISRERRDWIAEFEPQGGRPGYTVPIAFRRWRDGADLLVSKLGCNSETEVSLRLKRVAIWANQFSSRIHFEWVWDGEAIHVVQAQVEEPATGVKPRSLLPTQIRSVELTSLQIFHPAKQQDYDSYSKLRNAKMYGELGYQMPSFYVVDDYTIISNVLSGRIPPKLENDLIELTKRPLIIRTDGMSIPNDKREMLPRSEELRSYAEAKDWLLTHFKSQIEQSELGDSNLCLIAHHFIPSVASAWARAEPGKRLVRIESLWGIPEGLYWHSHDTFEVDTQTIDVDADLSTALLKYRFRERLRYKRTFIAPNEDGRWIPYQTAPVYAWNKSISRDDWLFEIAHTTRQVAEREQHAVSVMWFIDNHPQATIHKVLPWFHSKSELAGYPKAAPRRKYTSANDFIIKSRNDWQRLQQQYMESKRHIERVVVEPDDPDLIRNPQFAEDLADLAASKRFVVQLSGGILSHAYYILQRHGAQVECIDLFGADEEVVEYNKVVRDKVPSLIEAHGERVETMQLEGEALVAALRKKLVEEAFEALDAKSGEELIGELADVDEVFRALCKALKVTPTQIEAERIEKKERRGGFEKGLMLTKTATPHSIAPDPPPFELKAQQSSEPIISDASDLPTRRLYRRPDLRQVNQQLEKLFTFETEASKLEENATLNFSMPIDSRQQQNFSLSIELRRTRSSLRGIVRLRLLPSQLEIEFPDS